MDSTTEDSPNSLAATMSMEKMIEKISGSRKNTDGEIEYFLKWQGLSEQTWVLARDIEGLENVDKLLQENDEREKRNSGFETATILPKEPEVHKVNDEEEELDEVPFDDEEKGYFNVQRCGYVMLIDARESMFTKLEEDSDEEGITKFLAVIKSCKNMMLNKMFSKEKDLIGITLFGTKEADLNGPKHVKTLIDLNIPTIEAVKKLNEYLNDKESKALQEEMGSSDDFVLSDALWHCSSLFNKSEFSFAEKKIMIFTCDSDPHFCDDEKSRLAYQRARDLHSLKFTLEVFPFGTMDYQKFYKELVKTVNGYSSRNEIGNSVNSLDLYNLDDRFKRVTFKPRRFANLLFELGEDVSCGISLYSLFKEAIPLPTEVLNKATNESVKSVRQTYDSFGEILLPSAVTEFVNVAGKDITLNTEEKTVLKKLMNPGLKLLGFRDMDSAVPEAHHTGNTCFAKPDDKLVTGSRVALRALAKQCLEKRRVPFCAFTPRFRAATKFVCLLPNVPDSDDKECQIPTGFHVVEVPFEGDLRDIDLPPRVNVDEKTHEIAKQIVHKLTMVYDPTTINNPSLQKFWAMLEALALEYEAPEPVEDDTMPSIEDQTASLGDAVKQFKDACKLEQPAAAVKRSSANSGPLTDTPRFVKRAKLDLDDPNFPKQFETAAKSRTVEQFTVPELKYYLKNFAQLDVSSMKKLELVESVYNLH